MMIRREDMRSRRVCGGVRRSSQDLFMRTQVINHHHHPSPHNSFNSGLAPIKAETCRQPVRDIAGLSFDKKAKGARRFRP